MLISIFFRAKVTITDLIEMVPLVKKNVIHNKLGHTASVHTFQWGSDPSFLLSKDETFDMVLAADCIYYKEVSYNHLT